MSNYEENHAQNMAILKDDIVCQIDSCESVTAVEQTLSFCDTIKDQEDVQGLLTDYFHQSPDILSHYHHILRRHNDDTSFTILCKRFRNCKLINKHCSINTCLHFERYQKDTKSNAECTGITELFDNIHCYFIHSFDLVYRIPKEVYDNITDTNDTNVSVESINSTFQTIKQHISKQRTKVNISNDVLQRFTRSLEDRSKDDFMHGSVVCYHDFGSMDNWFF
eukprot:876169_1